MRTRVDSDAALMIAASLRGLRLHGMPGDLYAVYRMSDDGHVVPLQAWLDADAVRALLGAGAGLSLRAAAERDGLRWPDTPAAFLAAMTRLRISP
jgi:hypothetical protein